MATLLLADIVYGFQQTAVLPALPAEQADFGASREWATWLLSGYLIVASVTPIFFGKVADRIGKRRVYLGALAVFLAGSVICALAPTIGVLVLGRLVQGAGGAVFPLSFALVRDQLPTGRVRSGIGVLTGGLGLGALAGLAGGGAITQALSWRAVFWIGASALAVAIVLVRASLTESSTRVRRGLDSPGALLFGAAMAALIIALTEGPQRGWSSAPVVAAFVVSAATAASWVMRELHTRQPLMDLRVLASRRVLLANVASLATGYAVLGVNVLIPFLLQDRGEPTTLLGLAAGPLLTGIVMMPRALGQSIGGPITAPLERRLGPVRAFAMGMLLIVLAVLGLAVWRSQLWMIMLELSVLGIGFSLSVTMASSIVTLAADAAESGVAASINSVLRRLGGGIGAQIATALLATITLPNSNSPAPAAFTRGFLVAAIIAALGMSCALLVKLPPRSPGTRRTLQFK
jgi:EmrB/QacA subfamily drug resistance transporter